MHHGFWHERWENNQIGFHEGRPNTHLQAEGARLGARVFVPLCGKTVDLVHLLDQGHQVVGCELSAIAVDAFFTALGVTPEVEQVGSLRRHRHGALTLFQGDVFALGAEALGPIDTVYDRAALVALPPDLRTRYAAHLAELTDRAPQLLITFTHDLDRGPPFSLDEAEVERLHGERYALESLSTHPADLRGEPAREHVWWLTPR